MEHIIQIILNAIGLLFLLPVAIISEIIYFVTMEIIPKGLIQGALFIIEIIYVLRIVSYMISGIWGVSPKFLKRIIIISKNKNKVKCVKDKYYDYKIKDTEAEVINGTLEERRVFMEEQLNRVQLALKNNKYINYTDNKVKCSSLINDPTNGRLIAFHKTELALLQKRLPIDYLDKQKLYNKYNKLIAQLENDLTDTFKNYAILKKGVAGEDNVEKALALYGNRYKLLKNIRVEYNGQSSESDTIIICEKGVFVIEIKNYGKMGQTINITPDGLWYINNSKLNDVNEQNNYHCAINQTIINNKLKEIGYTGSFIDCNSIICIANNDVLIDNKSNQIVVRPSNIITEIKSINNNINLTEEVQEQIKKILLDNNLPEKAYEVIGKANSIEYTLNELNKIIPVIVEFQEIYEQFYYNIYNKINF